MQKRFLSVFLSVLMIFSLLSNMLATAETLPVIDLSQIAYADTSHTGWGKIGQNISAGGRPLTLTNDSGETVTYEKGIGLHANGELVYDISSYTAQGYNYFECLMGVDVVGGEEYGSVVFDVYVDGAEVMQTGVIMGADPAVRVQLDVTGAKELRFAVSDFDGINCDHANFVEMKLSKNDAALQRLSTVTLSLATNWLAIGESAAIEAQGVLVNGERMDLNEKNAITYASDRPAVAAVDEKTGMVTGMADGEAVITATAQYEGVTKTAQVHVMVNSTSWTVQSPDGKIQAKIGLADGKPIYQATYDEKVAIGTSDMGLVTSIGDFTKGLTFKEISTAVVEDAYEMYAGKTSFVTYTANETILTFEKNGLEFQVILRLSNDSMAFRYAILTGDGRAIEITDEATSYQVPAKATVVSQPYSNTYENHYKMFTTETLSGNHCLALLYQTQQNVNVLLTEADMGTDYCGSMLQPDGNGKLQYAFVGEQGSASVKATCDFVSPWRVALIGTMESIVESTTIEDLSPENRIEDAADWVVPGAVSWTWMTSRLTNNLEEYKRYVDLSAEMGWPYLLMDDGWCSLGADGKLTLPVWLDELVQYGEEKGVGLLAWMNHAWVNTEAKIDPIFKQLADAGIKGMKVDFFNSESQTTLALYDLLSRKAADYKLLVNFHGANKPTGERRTYPHVLTREGVLGNELTGAVNAEYNCLLAISRAVVGPTDYTPMITNDNVTTTHMAALAVLLEGGMPCFASSPEEYRSSNLYSWYRNMPAAWDESRLLDVTIGDLVSMARRSGEDWYLSAICNTRQDAVFVLDFLDADTTYYAAIYSDTDDQDVAAAEWKTVTAKDTLTVPMAAAGGCNVKLVKAPNLADEIILDEEEVSMKVGAAKEIAATVSGSMLTDAPILWTSSDPAVATVSGGSVAKIVAVDAGETQITAIMQRGEETVQASLTVTVLPEPYALTEDWTVLNENRSMYKIVSENQLTIYTDAGELYDAPPLYKNVFLTDVGKTDFSVTTKLAYAPTIGYQSAGLMLYQDDNNFISLQRRYHPSYNGNCICIVNASNGSKSEYPVADTAVGQDIHLKIEKAGSTFRCYWSVDDTNWALVGTVNNGGVSAPKAGLYTGKGGHSPLAASIPATFTDFSLDGTVIPFATAQEIPGTDIPTPAQQVDQLIEQLPIAEEITLADEAAVEAARAAYDALAEEDRADVTLYDKLTACEAAIAELKKSEYTMGDVDQNGQVDVGDIMKLKALIMADEWTDAEQAIGDMDGSTKLDVGDIMAIKNIIMGSGN